MVAARAACRRRICLCPEKGRFEFDVLDLSEALDALAKTDPRAASVVDLQLFGGLNQKECAVVLDVSEMHRPR